VRTLATSRSSKTDLLLAWRCWEGVARSGDTEKGTGDDEGKKRHGKLRLRSWLLIAERPAMWWGRLKKKGQLGKEERKESKDSVKVKDPPLSCPGFSRNLKSRGRGLRAQKERRVGSGKEGDWIIP